ncbi:MAG: RNA methyltransferase [Pyrinomonadaceae bacterium]|nr:RNA methyltransferase [Pyrinomonadaceae bacterium]
MITSRSNSLVKRARDVRDGRESQLIFLEGVRLCEEAVRTALRVEDVLYTSKLIPDERSARLLEAITRLSQRSTLVSEEVLGFVSDTKTPQGIVALAARPPTDRSVFAQDSNDKPLIVILHRVSNPLNAGAMLRVGEAAGATGAISTEMTTDLFSPKALRGAMGSSFRLPLWTRAQFTEVLTWCAQQNITTVSTGLRATRKHTEIDWTRPAALIVGAEGSGLEPSEMAATNQAIRIPMRPPVESLNVATALAIVLYEAARQRGNL